MKKMIFGALLLSSMVRSLHAMDRLSLRLLLQSKITTDDLHTLINYADSARFAKALTIVGTNQLTEAPILTENDLPWLCACLETAQQAKQQTDEELNAIPEKWNKKRIAAGGSKILLGSVALGLAARMQLDSWNGTEAFQSNHPLFATLLKTTLALAGETNLYAGAQDVSDECFSKVHLVSRKTELEHIESIIQRGINRINEISSRTNNFDDTDALHDCDAPRTVHNNPLHRTHNAYFAVGTHVQSLNNKTL